jgi:penicillin-binding protein 2
MLEHDNEEKAAKKRFSRRVFLLGGTQAAGFGLVGWRLFQLQVIEEGRYAPLADDNRVNLQVVAPKRGRLLDRRGAVLADNEETFRATLTPATTRDISGSLATFRRIVPLTPDEVEKIIRRAKKQNRNISIPIATNITFDQVAQINLMAPQLPGIRTEILWQRRYHGGAPAGHVVGYVGSVERVSVDDDAVMRLPEMRVGKSGVEAGLDVELRGTGGTQKIEVDARGRIVRYLESSPAKPGRDIALTIDTNLQRQVLERLQSERRAACVVLDIAGGEIVAMASTPSYDPAEIADGISDDAWQRLMLSDDKPLLNRAIGGQYPPGSTFKMVTALAALQAGLADLKERVRCDGQYELADQTYRCWKRSGHGAMTLHEAIRSSCDVYFFELARRLGIEALADTARMLGLGQTYACGLVQQKAGLVPDPDWKRGRWNAGWLGGETVLTGIGQGYMLSTPLQLAVMTARIASGKIVEPTLVKRDAASPLPVFESLALQGAHLEAVRKGMIAVVNEDGGTGSKAVLGDNRPVVAGKTGTSQISRASSERAQADLTWEQRDHALFVAYVPADAPRYAFAAIVEHGGGGGTTAAPLVRDVMNMVLELDPIANAGVSGTAVPLTPSPATGSEREG